jgi:hypothetical protein
MAKNTTKEALAVSANIDAPANKKTYTKKYGDDKLLTREKNRERWDGGMGCTFRN